MAKQTINAVLICDVIRFANVASKNNNIFDGYSQLICIFQLLSFRCQILYDCDGFARYIYIYIYLYIC